MILCIDLGATLTKIVILTSSKKVIDTWEYDSGKFKLSTQIVDFEMNYPAIKDIRITGGKTKKSSCYVDEIKAIGLGGSFISGKKKAIIASLGTGCAIISVKGKKINHVSGSGIGGGTFTGLGKLLIGTEDAIKIDSLALKGDAKKVNLLVKDIIGTGIGCVTGNSTASNFGNLKSKSKKDIAAGIASLVGETIGVLVASAAKAEKQKNIILTGKLVALESVRKSIVEAVELFNAKVIIPEMAEFATAIGAGVAEK